MRKRFGVCLLYINEGLWCALIDVWCAKNISRGCPLCATGTGTGL